MVEPLEWCWYSRIWEWYGPVWHGVWSGTVCDIVFWDGTMVRFGGYTIWKNHGMCYGMLVVWYDGTVWWTYYMAKYCLVVWYVSVYKVCKSRIRCMNIICNDLIYR